MKIVISDAFDPGLPAKLARYGEVLDKAHLASAEVLLVRSNTKCTRALIDTIPNLKLIIRGGVGLDNVDQAYCAEKGIEVFNTAAASSVSVAELAIALMLAVSSKITLGHEGMVKGEWRKKACERVELFGKTLGLIGAGRIATEVAIRARAFGMKVIAYDKYVTASEHAELLPLDEVIKAADYLSLHTPLTPETRGMINAERIAQMKPGAILINTGRSACVVEADVVAALESGHLAGFGNDVWLSDPPKDSPLMAAPNTVLLPHIGGSTQENLLRIGDIVCEILEGRRA